MVWDDDCGVTYHSRFEVVWVRESYFTYCRWELGGQDTSSWDMQSKVQCQWMTSRNTFSVGPFQDCYASSGRSTTSFVN